MLDNVTAAKTCATIHRTGIIGEAEVIVTLFFETQNPRPVTLTLIETMLDLRGESRA